ncbi:MAG: hypothetical protein KatS3mg057_3222 [Herpetosiphonaceae bacterium]|nr:MAG: hypothetical protein KatS3mg057_3222 [Herpetosiphonaceae bacterium]
MRKATDLIGRRVITQTTGEIIATIRDLVFDPQGRNVVAALVDGGGLFGEQRAVLWSSVIGIGDMIVVRGEQPIVSIKEQPDLDELVSQGISVVGAPVVSESGQRLGIVSDVLISAAGEVIGFEIGMGWLSFSKNKFLPASQVTTIGRDAIIASATELMTVDEARRERESVLAESLGSQEAPPLRERAVGMETVGEEERV